MRGRAFFVVERIDSIDEVIFLLLLASLICIYSDIRR